MYVCRATDLVAEFQDGTVLLVLDQDDLEGCIVLERTLWKEQRRREKKAGSGACVLRFARAGELARDVRQKSISTSDPRMRA